jgi:hypothetical protein
MRPYSEKTHHKKKGVAQGEGPEFKAQYCREKKTKTKTTHLRGYW